MDYLLEIIAPALKPRNMFAILQSISFWLLLVSPIMTLLHRNILTHTVRNLGSSQGDQSMRDHDFLAYYYMHTFILLSAVIVASHSGIREGFALDFGPNAESNVPFLLITQTIAIACGWIIIYNYFNSTEKILKVYHDFPDHAKPTKTPDCWEARGRVYILYSFILIDVFRIWTA